MGAAAEPKALTQDTTNMSAEKDQEQFCDGRTALQDKDSEARQYRNQFAHARLQLESRHQFVCY